MNNSRFTIVIYNEFPEIHTLYFRVITNFYYTYRVKKFYLYSDTTKCSYIGLFIEFFYDLILTNADYFSIVILVYQKYNGKMFILY
jgi:hypothetical protein